MKSRKNNVLGLVFDKRDPTGLGMFSKVGRLANQRHAVYKKTDEILSNKRKVFRISQIPQFNKNAEYLDMMNDDNDDEEEDNLFNGILSKKNIENDKKKKDIPEKKKKEKKDSFSKTVGRDDHFVNKNFVRSNNIAPPLGCYKPKLVNKYIFF